MKTKNKQQAVLIALLFFICSPYAFAQSYTAAPVPLQSSFRLDDTRYSYNPENGTISKTYTLTNVSGAAVQNPKLVNLFLWSNDISTSAWQSMAYNGLGAYSNGDQAVTAQSSSGSLDWSAEVSPASISSSDLLAALPLQTVAAGTSYPYWDIAAQWADGQTLNVTVQFANAQNCNWVQNMIWVVSGGGGPTLVELASLEAMPGDRNVTIIWKTASEVDNAGFNILRSEAGQGEPVKINGTLIAAKGSPAEGAEYIYTDSGVTNGVSYRYTLEDVDTGGTVTPHGPVRAVPRWVYSIFHK